MLSLKKSKQTKEDLIAIWLYGLEHYGESNADFYFDELETKIDSLLEYPEKYPLKITILRLFVSAHTAAI
jgi:plasmid stabilization system protein ParE